MSVNLKKNEAAILDAWKKVTENEDSYDWALFGYEGKTFALKVEAIGSGGIEAIAEEFNDGKIQYGFIRILDPNTKLAKLLLINFQGEAVLDLVHKGSCANHIRDITKLLKNHLTITVTNNDELDEDILLKKLSKITSAYNFETRTTPSDEKFVIGTNYSKVVPTKEIDCVKRDEFWKKEEEIEKARVSSDMEAKRFENLKIEDERLKREQREHSKREQLNKDLENKKTISVPREEIKAISPIKQTAAEKEQLPAKPRAEDMRNERRKEAQELIGNKVNTAKLMFQQQAAQNASKITSSTASHGPPAKPIRKTINKAEPEQIQAPIEVTPIEIPSIEIINEPVEIPEEVQVIEAAAVVAEEKPEIHDEEQFSTIKRSPKTPTTPTDTNSVFIMSDNYISNGDNVQEQKEEENHHQEINSQVEEIAMPEKVTTATTTVEYHEQAIEEEESDHLLKAVALYDYQAADETEISFDPGDLITHVDCIDPGWWQGLAVRFNTYGLFPANYVQLIDDIQATD